MRVPQGVICLLSALRVHGIDTQAPFEVWIAIPHHSPAPRLDQPAVRAVRMSGPALTELSICCNAAAFSATYDRVEMKIYVNGALSATKAYAAGIVNPVASKTGPANLECSNLKVGGSTTTPSTDTGNFQRQMDELRINDVGLTAGQVISRFAAF